MKFLLALVLALAACTSDVVLGSRVCNPLAGEACPCADTAECPDPFQCVAQSNTVALCTPPENCTLANGRLDCTTAPACVSNSMTCADNAHGCCATDLVCYPATCIGCCE